MTQTWLLFDSDDDSDYHLPVDELKLEEKEMSEESALFTEEEIMQLHIVRQVVVVGGRMFDDSISSDEDLTMDWTRTSGE